MSDARLSVAICSVPERAALVQRTLERLGRRVPVLLDVERRGNRWNSRRAWSAVDGHSTHHLVLEDDALVCRDFIRVAEAALTAKPDALVTFFTPKIDLLKAKELHRSWARISTVFWTQAISLPTSRVAQFLKWEREHLPEDYPRKEGTLGMFVQAARMEVFCTAPNLVNHAEVPSAMGHSPPSNRVSHWFLGDGDGSGIDWSEGLEEPIEIRYPWTARDSYRKWRKKNA